MSVYLSIGSNEGNRFLNLKRAIALLEANGFNVQRKSIILETEAILPKEADISWNRPYFNMVVSGFTKFSPIELLKVIKSIEAQMGREEDHKRWSPRVIDIDILLWDSEVIEREGLNVPHPEIFNRPFLIHLLKLMGVSISPNSIDLAFQSDLFTKTLSITPDLVGVVNITPDSFSDGGFYLDCQKAIDHAMKLSEQGASVIELGAQSTRPGATIISPEEEIQRITPVLDALSRKMEGGYDLTISIDSFNDITIQNLVRNYPISWVNDVKGDLSDETLLKVKKAGCGIIIMHSITIPPNQKDIIDENIPAEVTIYNFAKAQVERLNSLGFNNDKIIIDPGIGFGKSIYQNLELLRTLKIYRDLGVKILVGHSRKSFIKAFYKAPDSIERDLETIAISSVIYDSGVDYLRVHNIEQHQRFFVAREVVIG